MMRRIAFSFLLLFLSACIGYSWTAHARPVPPSPSKRGASEPDEVQQDKARRIYELVNHENRRLRWDDCLARQAFRRARYMVEQMDRHSGDQRYFAHEDPKTGKNPAWRYVYSCYRAQVRFAGENLSLGDSSAEVIHRNFMNSSSHRKNITSPDFSRVGIACYNYICVELFAGF